MLEISKEQEYSGVKIIGCIYLNEITLHCIIILYYVKKYLYNTIYNVGNYILLYIVGKYKYILLNCVSFFFVMLYNFCVHILGKNPL